MNPLELSEEELRIQAEAIRFVESHKQDLVDTFIRDKNPLPLGFITIFMAGSPGAGKTEFSKRYLPLLPDSQNTGVRTALKGVDIDTPTFDALIIRIDVDEIRTFLPQYIKSSPVTGVMGNAHIVHKAATKGLSILREYCFAHDISFLHDGTFGNYATMRDIVRKSIQSDREVQIYYLYIDPLVAWEFTQARERLEGRNILKERFIEQYFKSQQNVDRVKREFGAAVKINCVLKNVNNEVIDIALNWPSVSHFLEANRRAGLVQEYTEAQLQELLRPLV